MSLVLEVFHMYKYGALNVLGDPYLKEVMVFRGNLRVVRGKTLPTWVPSKTGKWGGPQSCLSYFSGGGNPREAPFFWQSRSGKGLRELFLLVQVEGTQGNVFSFSFGPLLGGTWLLLVCEGLGILGDGRECFTLSNTHGDRGWREGWEGGGTILERGFRLSFWSGASFLFIFLKSFWSWGFREP